MEKIIQFIESYVEEIKGEDERWCLVKALEKKYHIRLLEGIIEFLHFKVGRHIYFHSCSQVLQCKADWDWMKATLEEAENTETHDRYLEELRSKK